MPPAVHPSLRAKLLLATLLLVVGTAMVISWQAYHEAELSLREAAFQRLTILRETKKRQVEEHFRLLRGQMEQMVESPRLAEAMRDFAAAYRQVRPVDGAREQLWRHLLPTLPGDSDTPRESAHWLSADPAGVTLQLAYLLGGSAAGEAGLGARVEAASQAYAAAHDRHHPQLERLWSRLGLADFHLIDAESGVVVYCSIKDADFANSLLTGPFQQSNLAAAFRASLALPPGAPAHVADFAAHAPRQDAPTAYLGLPIRRGGELLGVLVAQLDGELLNALMNGGQRWRAEGLGDTGEVYLVGDDLTQRNDSRFLLEDPLYYQAKLVAQPETLARIRRFGTTVLQQQVATPMAREALAGRVGRMVAPDYRGVPVLSSYAPVAIDGLHWAILAEMDEAEALLPARRLAQHLAGLTLAVALVALVMAVGLANGLTASLRRLVEGLTAFGAGHLAQRLPVTGQDEVARVAVSFNQMADNLQATTITKESFDALLTSLGEALLVMTLTSPPEESGEEESVSGISVTGLRLLSYDREEELVGRPLEQIIQGGQAALCGVEPGMATLARQGCLGREVNLLTRQGETVPVIVSLSLLRDRQGKEEGVVLVGQDIRQRKAAEEALRYSQERFSRAQRIAHVGHWEWDLASNRLDWSDETYRIFGLLPQELVATYAAFLEWVHPEDRAQVEEKVRQALAGEGQYDLEHRLVRADGETRVVREVAEVQFNAAGQPTGMIGVIHDVTGWRRAEESLRLAAEVFSDALSQAAGRMRIVTKAFENAIEGVVITDAAGAILSVNPAFSAITGYSEAEALGQNPRILRSNRHDQSFYQQMWHTIRQIGSWQGEIWNRRKNGEAYPEQLTITAVADEQGQITHYVSVFHDLSDLKRSEAELHYRTWHDALTGLPNRELFRDRLTQATALAHRSHGRLALLMLDLDLFKHANDTLGPSGGDELLQQVAERLRTHLQEGDTVARLGGDEFALLLEGVATGQGAARRAVAVLGLLEQPFQVRGHEIFLSASVGVTLYPDDGTDADTLLRNADLAVNRAKASGRNNYQFYMAAMDQQAARRMALESELRRALERQELLLYYQPKVDLISGRVVSMEALVRWRHPEQGLVSPAEFIPLLEETGLIVPAGVWILREACRATRSWRRAGHPVRVAVNLSGRQLHQENLVEVVASALADSGLEPEGLELEITESMVLGDMDRAVALLTSLTRLGVHLSLDDFGTGYSSLSHLKRLPVHTVKIDQSFMRELTPDSDDARIVSAILSMAHSLGLQVVAEGVETEAQLAFLRQHDCDLAQGYFISRPLPEPEFGTFLAQDGRW